ncbi:anaphase-promoting complex subunit 10 isoform X2 [Tyto alba]|uniref:anaphase-promoting complex subunit 10 isoform X2 n=1 Tax=Tyto alba TaxID=56313 RepID=UPI001C66B286|nr:anaphase-promoting complex subunit 10 isoform X2 [Tyto alba]
MAAAPAGRGLSAHHREEGKERSRAIEKPRPFGGREALGKRRRVTPSAGDASGEGAFRERRKTTVKTLCIYADYKSDESYTPSKISVRVGNNFHNLQEIRQLELVEPSGWIHVPLTDTHKKPIRTFMIQIAVLANHQNGRDTHMRQIKVYTPVEESSIGKFPRCTTIDFMMYRSIR